MRRTKEEAEQTKKAILDAALDVFYEKSYDTATLSNIAKRAGVTRGAIYWHFENKFDILKEVTDVYFGDLIRGMSQSISSINDNDYLKKIKLTCDNYFERILFNPQSLKYRKIIEFKISYTEDTTKINNMFADYKKVIIEDLSNLIKKGKEHNQIRKDMSDNFLALSLVTWIIGFEKMILDPTEEWPLDLELKKDKIVENMMKFIKV